VQTVDFYCMKCKKSIRMSYCLCEDDRASVMNGIILRCHTRKCNRVVTLMKFTEGEVNLRTDDLGRCYI